MDACRWIVYLLNNSRNNRTYVGVTVNPTRRLRQHNREIKGGAKYTRLAPPGSWKYVCHVHGFQNQRQALQFEWAWHHCAPKRRGGLRWRLMKLQKVMSRERWVSTAPLYSEISLQIRWLQPNEHSILFVSRSELSQWVILVAHLLLQKKNKNELVQSHYKPSGHENTFTDLHSTL